MMVMTRRRCGILLLNDGSPAMDDGTSVMNGAAFVHHGLRPVARATAMHNGTSVMNGAALVHHGLCLVDRTTLVHNGTAVVDRTAVTDGTAFVSHGMCLVVRTGRMALRPICKEGYDNS